MPQLRRGPTDTPCGKCPSCVELARGGSGSLDVIEIDAASHGGVDDARDLRERAYYAPVRDRYKIFIIDEAHMVTSAGFNALLKIVEEPPEHIKFIFATTEPDKVIGTIRSRTHHYPFRLVPPEPLMAYLELLCTQQENVPVAPGVLSLVIRAGGVRCATRSPCWTSSWQAPDPTAWTTNSPSHFSATPCLPAGRRRRGRRRVRCRHGVPRRGPRHPDRARSPPLRGGPPGALPRPHHRPGHAGSAQAILRGMPADQIARLQSQATISARPSCPARLTSRTLP